MAGAVVAVTATVALVTPASASTAYHHPFYDITQSAFVEASSLAVGDQLQTADGGTATITGLRLYHATEVTYDLTINGLHTYYVEAGTTAVLVHNCGGGVAGAADDPASVDVSRIRPRNFVARQGNDPVYRVDTRHPNEVFRDGFQPWDANGNADLQATSSRTRKDHW